MNASWGKEIYTLPGLYGYEDSDVERSKIIGYYSFKENSEPIENLSALKYLSYKPEMINLDVNYVESEDTKIPNPFFKFITSNKEILHRHTGTGIEDAGFVFRRNTLSKIGSILFNDWSEIVLCAHLFRGVIYVYHKKYMCHYYKHANRVTSKIFNQYCNHRNVESDPNNEKFVIVLETNLKQHNILYTSELVGLEMSEEEIPPNLEKDLVIDEINKRNIVELFISTKPTFTAPKAMRIWTKCFWGNVDKILCGFAIENGIVTEVKSYNTKDLEDIGKGCWRKREILNFTGEILTFIKNCFKDEFKFVDVKSANKKLYFQKKKHENIKLVDERIFTDSHWVPDWFINNGSNV